MSKENYRYALEMLGDLDNKILGAATVKLGLAYVAFSYGHRTKALAYNLNPEYFKQQLDQMIDELDLNRRAEARGLKNAHSLHTIDDRYKNGS